MFKLVKSRFSEVHCETLFQKDWVDLQCQKRCVSVSGEQAQKEQESVSFLPILSLRILQLVLLCYVNNNTLSSTQRYGFYHFNGKLQKFQISRFFAILSQLFSLCYGNKDTSSKRRCRYAFFISEVRRVNCDNRFCPSKCKSGKTSVEEIRATSAYSEAKYARVNCDDRQGLF